MTPWSHPLVIKIEWKHNDNAASCKTRRKIPLQSCHVENLVFNTFTSKIDGHTSCCLIYLTSSYLLWDVEHTDSLVRACIAHMGNTLQEITSTHGKRWKFMQIFHVPKNNLSSYIQKNNTSNISKYANFFNSTRVPFRVVKYYVGIFVTLWYYSTWNIEKRITGFQWKWNCQYLRGRDNRDNSKSILCKKVLIWITDIFRAKSLYIHLSFFFSVCLRRKTGIFCLQAHTVISF